VGLTNPLQDPNMRESVRLPPLRYRGTHVLSVIALMCAVVGMSGGEVVNRLSGAPRQRGAEGCSCLSGRSSQWRLSTVNLRSLRLRGGSETETGQMRASPGHRQDGDGGEEDDEVEMGDELADDGEERASGQGMELGDAENEGIESGSEAPADDGVVMTVDSGDVDAAGEIAEDFMQSSDSERVDEDGMPCNTNFTGDNSR
jgi:hypothetical protein